MEENVTDSGGVTNFGVSLRFYRQTVKPDATESDIRNLSVTDAEHVYKTQFWDKGRYAELDSQTLATKMLDLSVNMGPHEANKLLQRAINVLNPSLVTVDGVVGIHTIAAANAADPQKLYDQLISEGRDFYSNTLIAHPEDRVFYSGWSRRLNLVPA